MSAQREKPVPVDAFVRRVFKFFDSRLLLETPSKRYLVEAFIALGDSKDVFAFAKLVCPSCGHTWASGCIRFKMDFSDRTIEVSGQRCHECVSRSHGDVQLTGGLVKFVARKAIDLILHRVPKGNRGEKQRNHDAQNCDLCRAGQFCPSKRRRDLEVEADDGLDAHDD